jgi:hypothetical protein
VQELIIVDQEQNHNRPKTKNKKNIYILPSGRTERRRWILCEIEDECCVRSNMGYAVRDRRWCYDRLKIFKRERASMREEKERQLTDPLLHDSFFFSS